MKRICGKSALGKAVESEKTEKNFLKKYKKEAQRGEKPQKIEKISKKFLKSCINA